MTCPVDTPDWRALPTRGQRAEARLAALLAVRFPRRHRCIAILVTLWGGAIAVFDVPPSSPPAPVDVWQAFLGKATGCSGRSASR
jgi:ABC-type nitrate/sulfonate/bicarbonate transport system permease component